MTYRHWLRPHATLLRRHLSVGVLLAIALSCGACSPAEKAPAIYADPSIAVEVRQGESFIISLSDDPANGLMWEAEYEEDILQLVSEELVFPEDRDCTLCSWGYYQFTFEAKSAGESEVACSYGRPGYPADTDDVRSFTVVVSP